MRGVIYENEFLALTHREIGSPQKIMDWQCLQKNHPTPILPIIT